MRVKVCRKKILVDLTTRRRIWMTFLVEFNDGAQSESLEISWNRILSLFATFPRFFFFFFSPRHNDRSKEHSAAPIQCPILPRSSGKTLALEQRGYTLRSGELSSFHGALCFNGPSNERVDSRQWFCSLSSRSPALN